MNSNNNNNNNNNSSGLKKFFASKAGFAVMLILAEAICLGIGMMCYSMDPSGTRGPMYGYIIVCILLGFGSMKLPSFNKKRKTNSILIFPSMKAYNHYREEQFKNKLFSFVVRIILWLILMIVLSPFVAPYMVTVFLHAFLKARWGFEQ